MAHDIDRLLQDIDRMTARADAQPEELYAARLVATDAARAVGAAKRAVAELQAALADEKASAMAVLLGDKKFKTIALRQAEVARLMQENAAAKDLEREIERAEVDVLNVAAELTAAELKVKRLEDEMRSLRVRTDLTAAQVQLLTEGR